MFRYLRMLANLSGCLIIAAGLLLRVACAAPGLSDQTLKNLAFEQKPGAQIPLSLKFQDEGGREVELSQYFGHKPVILVPGYYECPMLCTMVLNGLIESLEDLKWTIGKEFEVVNFSIDPQEAPSLAAAKKQSSLRRYGREGAGGGWHFLTGREDQIRQLADSIGFTYAYDPVSKQYAHPSGVVILTADGKVAKYLFGVGYSPQDLFSGLKTASSGEVASPIRNLLLLCFHYNPISGKYGAQIILTIRILSIATLLGLAGWIFLLSKRGHKPAS